MLKVANIKNTLKVNREKLLMLFTESAYVMCDRILY